MIDGLLLLSSRCMRGLLILLVTVSCDSPFMMMDGGAGWTCRFGLKNMNGLFGSYAGIGNDVGEFTQRPSTHGIESRRLLVRLLFE